MKIAQISKADSFGGGASRVATDLTNLLNENGQKAVHWMSWSGSGFDTSSKFPLFGNRGLEVRFLQKGFKKLGLIDVIPFDMMRLLRRKRYKDYDIFHYHDLSSAISPLSLLYFSQKMPVVWTIHDCSPFTAGCLYPMDCERFCSKDGCKNCPQIGQWPIDSWFDTSTFLFKIKKYLHSHGNVTLVSPSNWMADMAKKSGIVEKQPYVIPNGVDTRLFNRKFREEVRSKYNLQKNRPVILLSAGNVRDERKGINFALKALRACQDLSPQLLIVGSADKEFLKELDGFSYVLTGYVGEPEELSEIYSAADIFLFCSLADNMPLTILETMSCGVPMIGFRTGGIPEMIDQKETGILVPQKDVDALIEALRSCLTEKLYIPYGKASFLKARRDFSMEKFYERHLELYESLLENKKE
ncbi:MAG: glycosyltransferase [Parasutterella sp.]|mgnify:CR=1 FL=1|uniref:glycosyltransferase n=1 Tax=Parasutterella sp. TaxID=2049037 RepID=UPI00399B36A4